MADPDLNLIGRQLDRVLAELRDLHHTVRSLHDLRDEFRLLREQVRMQGASLDRLDDTIRMDVLERLQTLEQTR